MRYKTLLFIMIAVTVVLISQSYVTSDAISASLTRPSSSDVVDLRQSKPDGSFAEPDKTKPTDDGDQAFDTDLPARANFLSASHLGRGPVPPLPKSDAAFVTDKDTYLDQYLYRKGVPNGRLPFTIAIDRYYSPLITSSSVDPNTGRLKEDVLKKLIAQKALPERAQLTLSLYDVDHNATSCPEVDHVFINGTQLLDTLRSPVALTSGNNTWSVISIPFPIGLLRFPTEPGDSTQRPSPAANRIEIDVDVQCLSKWAIEVDWGAIQIPDTNTVRPFVFVHGWTGNENTFKTFLGFMDEDGIPYRKPINYNDGIGTITETARIVVQEVISATRQFGVDRVNVFAHSRGGLFIRKAMRDPALHGKVEYLVTFASPHHGANWTSLAFIQCRQLYDKEDPRREQCIQSGKDMHSNKTQHFNYRNCKRKYPWSPWTCEPLYTEYMQYIPPIASSKDSWFLSFVAMNDLAVSQKSATYPWKADKEPFPDKPNLNGIFYGWLASEAHSLIKEKRSVYQCAMSHIDNSRYSAVGNCPSEARIAESLSITPSEIPEEIILLQEEIQLAGSEVRSFDLRTAEDKVMFNLIADDAVTFTLIDPTGRTIDANVATTDSNIDYFAEEDAGIWSYQYQIINARAGDWRVTISTTNATEAELRVIAESDLIFSAGSEQSEYLAGDQVVITGALLKEEELLKDSTIVTGTATYGTTTVPLILQDNGSSGDKASGDGVYTALFNAPNYSGWVEINLYARTNTIQRVVRTFFAVAQQTAIVQQVSGESAPDVDGNRLRDNLTIDVNINVLTSGDYTLFGRLIASDGETVAFASNSSSALSQGQLIPGVHTIPLLFSGREIRESGADGPYTLAYVALFDQTSGDFVVDSQQNMYVTAAYSATEFEGTLLRSLGGADEAIDTNSNGKFDQLRISVDFEVLLPGNYRWNARLVDQDGIEIGWSDSSGWLNNQTPMQFTFDGRRIAQNAEDGPYFLQDLTIFQTSGGTATASMQRVLATQAYNYLNFEGALPKVQFASRSVDVIKGSGQNSVMLVLNAPLGNDTTLVVRTQDGSATAGKDYVSINDTITVPAGELAVPLPLTILDDGSSEGAEYFVIAFEPVPGLLTGRNNPVTVHILDFGAAAALNTTASPVTLIANGSSTSTITASVKDAFNNPVSGESVTFNTTLGSIPATGVTDSNGVVTTDLTSATSIGIATVTTTVGSINKQTQVQFVAGPPATIAQTGRLAVLADGVSTVDIAVTVRDAHNNVVEGQRVEFSTTVGAITGEATTNAQGVATATFTAPATPGTAVVTAKAGTVTQTFEITLLNTQEAIFLPLIRR